MNSDAPTDSEIEARLNLGVLNYWYAVAPSYLVTRDKPISITRVGRDVVLWRNSKGKVQAVDNRCPHRGARLCNGNIRGDNIECAYHGVALDGMGSVIKVPAVNDCKWEGIETNQAYVAVERYGAVFLYFGDALNAVPQFLAFPEQLSLEHDWAHFLCVAEWQCNYRYALDNLIDPMHGAYLHAESHTMHTGNKNAEMEIVKTQTGFIIRKTDQKHVNFDWSEFGETGIHWIRLSIPYPPGAGPGGPFYIIAMATPVDEDNSLLFFWRCRKVRDFQRALWQFMYRAKLEPRHWQVLEQDRNILETMPNDARKNEKLYSHDIGVTRLRALLRKIARNQLMATTAHKINKNENQ